MFDYKFLAKKYLRKSQDLVYQRRRQVNGLTFPIAPGQPLIYDPEEPFLNEFILKPSKGSFVDVGANIGAWTVLASPFYYRVYAFEPNWKVYRLLRKTVRMNHRRNVTVYPFALDDRRGPSVQRMTIPKSPEIGLELALAEGRTLDEFKIPDVNVIKLDVEGAAMRVLRGAKKTLESHPLVIVEAHTSDELKAIDFLGDGYRWERRIRTMPIDYPFYTAIVDRKQPFLIGIPDS